MLLSSVRGMELAMMRKRAAGANVAHLATVRHAIILAGASWHAKPGGGSN